MCNQEEDFVTDQVDRYIEAVAEDDLEPDERRQLANRLASEADDPEDRKLIIEACRQVDSVAD